MRSGLLHLAANDCYVCNSSFYNLLDVDSLHGSLCLLHAVMSHAVMSHQIVSKVMY